MGCARRGVVDQGSAATQGWGSGHTGARQGLGHGSQNTVQGTKGTNDRGATLVVVVVQGPVELRARELRGQGNGHTRTAGTGGSADGGTGL